jgi:hypothetical protein
MAAGKIKAICALARIAVAGVGASAVLLTAVPVSATDADVYVLSAGVTTTDPLVAKPVTTAYSIATGACVSASVFPGFIDVAGDETGPCTAMSGGGNLTLATACSTGLITANWNLTEHSGDVANFTGTGVVIGGLTVIAGTPRVVGGYKDPATSTSPGSGVSVGVLLPALAERCNVDGVTHFTLDEVLVGQY